MNKKSKTLLMSIIGILTIVIVGLIGFIVGSGKKNSKKENVTEGTTVEVSTTTTEQITIATSTEALSTEEKRQEADCYVKISKTNSWESDGKYSAQYDMKIVNKSSFEIQDWAVKLNFPDGASLDNIWNGDVDNKEKEITVKAVEFNRVISKGMTLGDIGFIATAKTQEDLNKIENEARLFIDGKEYAASSTENEEKFDDKQENTTEEQKIEKKKSGRTPFEEHGKLKLDGTNIVDKDGNKFQLKGISSHGIAWFPEYINEKAFKTFRDEWEANLIRLAMYTSENNGYCEDGDKSKIKGLVKSGVQYATDLGMYVIIDWHVLRECNPLKYKDEAKVFFEEMSKEYKDYDNVIYEICNEPNGDASWEDVKKYAEEIIPIIRKNAPDSIIIVGTPTWSQDVDVAAKNPIEGYDNIMYAVHFYAATHKENIRSKVVEAVNSGLPVFVSEFSICDASGNGGIDYDQADEWFNLIGKYNLSYAAWNLSNKDETSSLIKSSCTKVDSWSDDELSETGIWLKKQLSK